MSFLLLFFSFSLEFPLKPTREISRIPDLALEWAFVPALIFSFLKISPLILN